MIPTASRLVSSEPEDLHQELARGESGLKCLPKAECMHMGVSRVSRRIDVMSSTRALYDRIGCSAGCLSSYMPFLLPLYVMHGFSFLPYRPGWDTVIKEQLILRRGSDNKSRVSARAHDRCVQSACVLHNPGALMNPLSAWVRACYEGKGLVADPLANIESS